MSDENLCPECGLSIAECNRRALGRIHRGRDAMDFISDAPPGTLSVWPEDKSLPEGWKWVEGERAEITPETRPPVVLWPIVKE
jgi:hypothetical protein